MRALQTSQPLGASERFFVAQHRLSPTNLARVLLLERPPSPSAVQHALTLLAERHSAIRSRIRPGVEPSFVHNAAPVPIVRVTPRADDSQFEGVLTSTLNTPLDTASGPLLAAHYVYSRTAERAELIVVAEHAISDGISMNSLCAELMALCTGAKPAPRARALPVLEALLPPFTWRARALGLGASLARFARIHARRALKETRNVPRTSAVLSCELSQEDTAQLIRHARQAQSTVTGALMAAALLAIADTRPGARRLSVSVPVNLRPRLKHHHLTPDDLGNLTSAVYLNADTRSDFWPLARSLKRDLDHTVESDLLLAAVVPVYKVGTALLRGLRPTLAHAMVSNSGNVPVRAEYGRTRVLGFRSATSAPMLSADFAFFCNTLDGRLCVNLVFAEEVASRDEAAHVLARLRFYLAESA